MSNIAQLERSHNTAIRQDMFDFAECWACSCTFRDLRACLTARVNTAAAAIAKVLLESETMTDPSNKGRRSHLQFASVAADVRPCAIGMQ